MCRTSIIRFRSPPLLHQPVSYDTSSLRSRRVHPWCRRRLRRRNISHNPRTRYPRFPSSRTSLVPPRNTFSKTGVTLHRSSRHSNNNNRWSAHPTTTNMCQVQRWNPTCRSSRRRRRGRSFVLANSATRISIRAVTMRASCLRRPPAVATAATTPSATRMAGSPSSPRTFHSPKTTTTKSPTFPFGAGPSSAWTMMGYKLTSAALSDATGLASRNNKYGRQEGNGSRVCSRLSNVGEGGIHTKRLKMYD
jgi:hypothetical protein